MNEIEQMYRNAGIERKKPACIECFLDRHFCNRTYDECPELYPPFTPAKQLEVIKAISIRQGVLLKQNRFFIGFESGKTKDLVCAEDLDLSFEVALAALINHLWQNLAEDEKQKIREILKKCHYFFPLFFIDFACLRSNNAFIYHLLKYPPCRHWLLFIGST